MILLPIHKLEIPNCPPNFIDTILSKTSNSNFWNLKVSRKNPYVFKILNFNNKFLLCIKANENFIISGNILLISCKKETKKNVWFISNVFMLLSFLCLAFQTKFTGFLIYDYMVDNHLSFIETLKSKYFETFFLKMHLRNLISYIFTYFLLVYLNITYWKKTFSTLLNGK